MFVNLCVYISLFDLCFIRCHTARRRSASKLELQLNLDCAKCDIILVYQTIASENKKSLLVIVTQETFFVIILCVNIRPRSRGNLHQLGNRAKSLL